MNATERDQLEHELEHHNRVIKAAEDWSKEYSKDPETHAQIIKVEAKIERILRGYFRELSTRIATYVDWYAYSVRLHQVQAAADDFTVDVIVTDDAIANEDGIVMKLIYDPIASGVAVGAAAGENIYGIPLGLTDTSASIQQVAKEQVANLVGKRVQKDGTIVDNPKAKYRISEKTRNDIRHSISTSLSLGEDQASATDRLSRTIKNPKRAALIAQNEAVDAYQGGLYQFGIESGAEGKEWQDIGATDVCRQYSMLGVVALNFDYNGAGLLKPRAHVGCRCGMRYVYAEELGQ